MGADRVDHARDRNRWVRLGARDGDQPLRAAPALLAAGFLAAGLRAAGFLAPLVAGPLARFSASSSAARSIVTDSTESAVRRVAFVVPSVTYGPKRPSLTTTGAPLAGSVPSSRRGAAAAARPPRPRLGSALQGQGRLEGDVEELVLAV